MTLAAETSSLPAIAKALTDQAHSRLGLLGSPCVGTFIRNVSLWALFTAAALGLLGLTSLTGLGTWSASGRRRRATRFTHPASPGSPDRAPGGRP